jgi:hypothetical protein
MTVILLSLLFLAVLFFVAWLVRYLVDRCYH